MSNRTGAAGLAALPLCESLLLSLTENGVIGVAEAKAILADAAAAHPGAAASADGGAVDHAEAAALLEAIRLDGDAVRPARRGPPRRPTGTAATRTHPDAAAAPEGPRRRG